MWERVGEFGTSLSVNVMVKFCLAFTGVFQVKFVWVVSAFRPSHNRTKLRPSDLVLSLCQEAKDDANSPPDLAEVPVATGNRKQGMLQPFPSCQPKTRHDRI